MTIPINFLWKCLIVLMVVTVLEYRSFPLLPLLPLLPQPSTSPTCPRLPLPLPLPLPLLLLLPLSSRLHLHCTRLPPLPQRTKHHSRINSTQVPKVENMEVGRFTNQAQQDKRMLADGQKMSTHVFSKVLNCMERNGNKLRHSSPPDQWYRPEHTHKNTFKSY